MFKKLLLFLFCLLFTSFVFGGNEYDEYLKNLKAQQNNLNNAINYLEKTLEASESKTKQIDASQIIPNFKEDKYRDQSQGYKANNTHDTSPSKDPRCKANKYERPNWCP